MLNTVGKASVTQFKKDTLHIDILESFYLKFNIESSNDHMLDLQLLTGRDNSQSDPMAQVVYGVGSAHNKATYLTHTKQSARGQRHNII